MKDGEYLITRPNNNIFVGIDYAKDDVSAMVVCEMRDGVLHIVDMIKYGESKMPMKPEKHDFIRPIDIAVLGSIKKIFENENVKSGKKIGFSQIQIEAIKRMIKEIEHRDDIHDVLACECMCYYCREYCEAVQQLLKKKTKNEDNYIKQ